MRKRFGIALCLLTALHSPAFAAAPTNDWLMVPGVRAGFIRKDTTESDLRVLGGVTAKEWYGDGESDITTLYAGTPQKIRVFWSEATPPKMDMICAERPQKGASPWQTKAGIRLGLPLDELQKRMGYPLQIQGFGWDYGGFVSNAPHGLRIGLGTKESVTDPRLTGDILIKADNPALKGVHPYVDTLCVEFYR